MQKVDGVQSVHVSLNEGLTILDLKPGNSVTLAELRRVIKNSGFASNDATVVARGTPGAHGFVVSGTGEQLATTSDPVRVGDAWKMTTNTITGRQRGL